MKYLKKKDNKNRQVFKKSEKRRTVSKFLFINFLSSRGFSSLNQLKSNSFIKKSLYSNITRVRIVNRCPLTNRARGTFKKINASRFILRDLMQFGLLPGYKKSVW